MIPFTLARRELVIRVHGIPAPQGSKSYKGLRGGKPILVESSKKVTPWRDAVAAAATLAMREADWVTLDCPVLLDVVFYLPAPKTMPKGRTGPTTYPDLSKLVRSTEDALVSAGVMADDSRILRTVSEKRYADNGTPGATIRVSASNEIADSRPLSVTETAQNPGSGVQVPPGRQNGSQGRGGGL